MKKAQVLIPSIGFIILILIILTFSLNIIKNEIIYQKENIIINEASLLYFSIQSLAYGTNVAFDENYRLILYGNISSKTVANIAEEISNEYFINSSLKLKKITRRYINETFSNVQFLIESNDIKGKGALFKILVLKKDKQLINFTTSIIKAELVTINESENIFYKVEIIYSFKTNNNYINLDYKKIKIKIFSKSNDEIIYNEYKTYNKIILIMDKKYKENSLVSLIIVNEIVSWMLI